MIFLTRAVLALLFFAFSMSSVEAASRVDLTLAVAQGAPIMAQQDWVRALAEAGLANVKIRPARVGDEVGIENRGSEQSPVYAVTGVLTSRNELRLPGGSFKQGEIGLVVSWITNLALHGPTIDRGPKVAFGLRQHEFNSLYKDLSKTVNIPTKGVGRGTVVRQIGAELKHRVKLDPMLFESLNRGSVGEDLAGLSSGTALAYVLSPMGLCFAPLKKDGEVECVTKPSGKDHQAWPIGWPPRASRADLLPKLFEFISVNVRDVSLAKLLDVVSDRVEATILVDHASLARERIDPEAAAVLIPRSRTTCSLLLKKALWQAKLEYKLLVDEAGKPFLWVTAIKRN